jgi:hypothetical protein
MKLSLFDEMQVEAGLRRLCFSIPAIMAYRGNAIHLYLPTYQLTRLPNF